MDHKCNSIRTRRAFSLLSENLPVFISKLKRSPKSVRLIDPNLRKWGIIQEKNRNYFAEPLIGTPARFHSRNLSALWRISSRAGWKCRVGFRSANGGYDNGGGAPSNPYRPRKRARRGAIIRDFWAPSESRATRTGAPHRESGRNHTKTENDFNAKIGNARLAQAICDFAPKRKCALSFRRRCGVSSALSHFRLNPPIPRKTTAKPANVIMAQEPCRRHVCTLPQEATPVLYPIPTQITSHKKKPTATSDKIHLYYSKVINSPH